jgi:Cys-rich protein (TIGR01571 family)
VLNALSFGTQQKTTVLTEEGKNTQEENLIELDESGSKMEGQSEQEALVEIKSEETASGIIADKPSVDPSIEQQPSTAGQVSPQSVASETRQVPHVASDEPSERFRAKMSSTADDGTYLLAKQQLQAELREASNLMAQSITPETTNFWRDHVLDLQARLRALHEQESRSVGLSRSPKPQTPTDILENNRRLVSEFQQREHYVPPVSLSQSRDTPKLELPTPQNIRTPTPQPMPQQMMQRDVVEPEGDYEMPMVDVVAPADLPAGYNFEAEIEGQRFLATVPPGGVRQGETFTCYMRELNSVSIDIPVGYWKDDLSNVCKYGWCHGVVCNTIFFPLITLGQIQTRINLDFLGRERFGSEARSNRFMMVTVIAFWIATNIALFAACNWKWSRGMELSFADGAAICLINLSMYAFTVFVTQATRSSLREKFMIREERCFDLEDLVCSAACLPCTICQMARHTANYDDYEAVCCSKTGLPDGVRVNQAPVKETDGYIV